MITPDEARVEELKLKDIRKSLNGRVSGYISQFAVADFSTDCIDM
jgi:hypothetical protein